MKRIPPDGRSIGQITWPDGVHRLHFGGAVSHIRPKNLISIGIAPRWDITCTDISFRDKNSLDTNGITSAGHQYASPSPRLSRGCPDRVTKTQTHEPSLSLLQVSREKEMAGGEKVIFGDDIVRPRTDLPEPSTPLRTFFTLEVSAGVFGDVPSVKEADEIKKREDIEADCGLCFGVFLVPVPSGGPLNRSAIDRVGVGGKAACWRVGEGRSSSEDNSLSSESDPGVVESFCRLVPLTL